MRISGHGLSTFPSLALAAAFLITPLDVTAQAGKPQPAAAGGAEKKDPWKPEDIIYAETANPQTRISPDGKWLVWVKSSGDKEKDLRVSNLMLTSLS